MTEVRKFQVKVGEVAQVKRSVLPFGPRTDLIYTGMAGKEIFSLAVAYSVMYNSLAYNVYLPLGTREATLGGGRIEIMEVTPEYILFNYIG